MIGNPSLACIVGEIIPYALNECFALKSPIGGALVNDHVDGKSKKAVVKVSAVKSFQVPIAFRGRLCSS